MYALQNIFIIISLWWPRESNLQTPNYREGNWQRLQLLDCEIHHCVCTEAMPPMGSPHQLLSVAGILRQTYFWETWNSSDHCLWLGDPLRLCQLRLQGSLECVYPTSLLPLSFIQGQTCMAVYSSLSLFQFPPCLFSLTQEFPLIKSLRD